MEDLHVLKPRRANHLLEEADPSLPTLHQQHLGLRVVDGERYPGSRATPEVRPVRARPVRRPLPVRP